MLQGIVTVMKSVTCLQTIPKGNNCLLDPNPKSDIHAVYGFFLVMNSPCFQVSFFSIHLYLSRTFFILSYFIIFLLSTLLPNDFASVSPLLRVVGVAYCLWQT